MNSFLLCHFYSPICCRLLSPIELEETEPILLHLYNKIEDIYEQNNAGHEPCLSIYADLLVKFFDFQYNTLDHSNNDIILDMYDLVNFRWSRFNRLINPINDDIITEIHTLLLSNYKKESILYHATQFLRDNFAKVQQIHYGIPSSTPKINETGYVSQEEKEYKKHILVL